MPKTKTLENTYGYKKITTNCPSHAYLLIATIVDNVDVQSDILSSDKVKGLCMNARDIGVPQVCSVENGR